MAYMTQEGYDKMVAQLRHMESIERPAASAAIAEAADKGDLSENSEYDAAKENQSKTLWHPREPGKIRLTRQRHRRCSTL